MEDNYIRPVLEETDCHLKPIDIVLLALSVICFVVTVWTALIISKETIDIPSEEPIVTDFEIVETAPIETRNPIETEIVEIVDEVKYFDVPLDEELQDHIFEVCDSYSIDPAIVISMIERESGFNYDIVGDNGKSFGLMQIQPKWHQDRMDKLGVTDLLNPYQNVVVGIDYLAELFGRTEDVVWVLMAYNGGPSYANKWYSQGITSKYAAEVITRAEELNEQKGENT